MSKDAYLRITRPAEGLRGDGHEIAKWLMQEDAYEDMAQSLEKIYDLGGFAGDRHSIESLRGGDGEGLAGFVATNIRKAIASHGQQLTTDMKEMDSSRVDGEEVHELHFDPSEWFAGGNEDFYSYTSGRLYWLAAIGVLERMGFKVEGSGL